MEFEILRGQNEIGANLIEITHKNTVILVELGKGLSSGEELTEIESAVIAKRYDAVIVTHCHADHAGLINLTESPVYMGVKTKKILDELHAYTAAPSVKNYFTFTSSRPFFVGGIKITPYLCDHSAFDSHMLLFEAGGKSILYTGDFRFHGRKSGEKLIKSLPAGVDVLLYDGTNIDTDKPCISESRVEMLARREFKSAEKKPVFIFQSSTNIDRLVTFYRASTECGRTVYMDDFQCAIAEAAGGKIPRPDEFNNVYACTFRPLTGARYDRFKAYSQKRGIGEIARRGNFTMFVRQSALRYLKGLAKRLDLNGALFVYSMWDGYKRDEKMQKFLSGIKSLGMKTVTLHTSGHASKKEIDSFISAIKPKQAIAVHTEQ